MRRPGRGADQIAVGNRTVDGDVGISSAGKFHLDTASRIGPTGSPLEDPCPRKNLCAVANRGHRLILVKEVLNDLDHARVEPQISGARPPE